MNPSTVRDLLCEAFWPMLDSDQRWLQMSSASNEYAQKARRTLAVLLVDYCKLTIGEAARFTGRTKVPSKMELWVKEARADKEIMVMAEAVARLVKETQGGERVGTEQVQGPVGGDRRPGEAAGNGQSSGRAGRQGAARVRLPARG